MSSVALAQQEPIRPVQRHSPLRSIRRHCLLSCMGGSRRLVRDCEDRECELWLYRFGRDPWRSGNRGSFRARKPPAQPGSSGQQAAFQGEAATENPSGAGGGAESSAASRPPSSAPAAPLEETP